MHTANKQKKNLDFGLKPSKRLDDTTITVEIKYSIHFTATKNKFCITTKVTVLLIVILMAMLNHGKHIYQYKVKVSEMKVCSSLCFVTISKDS